MIKRIFIAGMFICFSLGWANVTFADTALFVLDVSGSMKGKVGGDTKMEAAKRTFGELVDGLPGSLQVGLEAYGHYGDKDCSAIEVLVPPASGNAAVIKSKVQELAPHKGATPIAKALDKAAETLRGTKGAKTIILISDGKETCGGDPVATAQRLTKEGIGVKIHVIGFDVGAQERQQLEGIAKAGGGKYFAAADAAELAKSFAAVKKEVVKEEPTSKVIFRDDFDGEFLSDQWELVNPNEDVIIVEDGALQIIAEPYNKKLFNPNNLVVLKQELPKSYEIELKLKLTQLSDVCSWESGLMTGILLFRDPDNAMALFGGNYDCYGSGADNDALHFIKMRKGKMLPDIYKDLGNRKEERGIILRLRREQRKFIAYWQDAKGKWVKLGEYAELRPNYRLALFATRAPDAREALEKFDWIEIRELK